MTRSAVILSKRAKKLTIKMYEGKKNSFFLEYTHTDENKNKNKRNDLQFICIRLFIRFQTDKNCF